MFASSRLLSRSVPLLVFSALAFSPGNSVAQTPVSPAPATTAVTLSPFQQKALLAFSPTSALFSGLTMTGTVNRTSGSLTETGTVQLHSAADGSSTETWTGAGSNRVITCTAWASGRACTITMDGKTRDLSGVASQRTVAWFAPWAGISLLSGLLTTAAESTDGKGDEVLAFSPVVSANTSLPAAVQKDLQREAQWATVSVLFDAGTALPSGLHYLEPLNNETSNAIDVSVVYSDYSREQGFMVPHRIQRYLQRTLEADIRISSVTLN